MSGLDKAKNVSSEPVIAPTLQSEDLYAQTVTATNLVVEGSVTFPSNYTNIFRWSKICVGGETSLTGKDYYNSSLVYTPGYEQVYVNGILLFRDLDYTASTGTSITNLSPLALSDVVEVIAPSAVSIGDYYTKAQADAKFSSYNSTVYSINSVTTSYTLQLDDKEKLILMNSSSPLTLTIPSDSTNFLIGSQVNIVQMGTGQVTIAGSGFTPVATPGLKLRTQYSSATVIKLSSNSWLAMGDLTAI
jgi:hypothetical protein